jgi:hypothetical protein
MADFFRDDLSILPEKRENLLLAVRREHIALLHDIT